MRWAVYVTTCPREESTLGQTIDSLGGWPEPTVLTDLGRTGARNALLRALRLASERDDWDRLLVSQDDVLYVPGVRDWVEHQHHIGSLPDGLVSLWLPDVHQKLGNRGWWRLADKDLPRKAYGALAYVFDRPLVEAVLQVGNYNNQPNKSEFLIGKVCRDTGMGYWYYERSFCQHLGKVSTISKGLPFLTHFRSAASDWNAPCRYDSIGGRTDDGDGTDDNQSDGSAAGVAAAG